jgi:hypothetical protein
MMEAFIPVAAFPNSETTGAPVFYADSITTARDSPSKTGIAR